MDLRRGRGKERVFGDSGSGSSTSASKREIKEVSYDNRVNVREGVRGLRLEESGAGKKKEFVERYNRLSEFPTGHDFDTNVNRNEPINSSVGDGSAQLRYLPGSSLGSRGSMNQWGVERDRYEGFYGNPRAAAERAAYPNEGTSNYHLESFHDYGEQKYDVNGDEDLGPDRAELLRKLDQLTEQLSRSYASADRDKKSRTPPDPYGDLLTYNLSLQQQYAVENQMPRSPYLNYTRGVVPIMDHHNMDMKNYNPPQRNNLNVIPEYEDSFEPQMPRSASQHPIQYAQSQHVMRQHMDFNRNSCASFPAEHVGHPPACTCSGCYNQNWVVPPQLPQIHFGNRSVPKGPANLSSYHQVNPATFSPRMMHTRWQGEIGLHINGYGDQYPGKLFNRKTKISHPFHGGAPFIACFHCFELLKLPRKFQKRLAHQSELRCGSCMTVISVEVNDGKLITSASKESKQSSAEVDQSSKEVVKQNTFSYPDCVKADDSSSCHDDLDNSSQNLKLIVVEDNSLVEDERLILDKFEKREGHSSSSSVSFQEGEGIPDSMVIQRDVSDSAEILIKDACSPKALGSSLWEQPNSPFKHEVSRAEKEKGNNGACIDHDEVIVSKSTSAQDSMKDRSVETEVDDSFNDYLNTNISQDSTEASKEDRPKIRKGADNFLIGFIKKSFKDSSKSYQDVERTKVLINGHPIPDHLVRRAEKLAGSVQPGDYWYDFKAGFWGVMGHPCLGIIPPAIEAFSYPLPTNCGAGNTGVYVNGRELHQRDLDLLASRGLPTTRERFYILEISGRLVDEDSGEELKSLGRLAPTIEKVKHGFGMRVPRMAV